MAHTYIVQSATNIGNDTVTVTGTVDGFSVTINIWASALNALANTTAVQNFIAPKMLAQAVAQGSIAPAAGATVPTVTAAGTFSQ